MARDRGAPPSLLDQADERFGSVLDSLSALAGGDLPAPASWWRRRQLERALGQELRVLGLRVALSEGGAVLLDPALRGQAAQVRATWQELHPATPAVSPTPTKDLLASVEEMRRRLGELDRLIDGHAPPRPRVDAYPAAVAATRCGVRRVARRR